MSALEEKREGALESTPVTMADLDQFTRENLTVWVLNGDGQKHPKPIGKAVESLYDELTWLRDIGRGYKLLVKYKWQITVGGVLIYQFIASNGLGSLGDFNVFDLIKSIF
jgi:hypothetical protein